MAELHTKLLRLLGYGSFFVATFMLFIYWTFPYKRLFEKFTHPLQKRAQLKLGLKDLRLHYLTGVKIERLNIQKQVKKGTAEVQIGKLVARLSLLPLLILKQQVQASIEVARGKIDLKVSHKRGKIELDLNTEGLQLGALGPPNSAYLSRSKDDPPRPLLDMLFAPIFGRVNAKVKASFYLPGQEPISKGKRKASRRRRRRRTPDLTKLTGRLRIRIRGFSVGSAKTLSYFPTQQFGELPVPLLELGTIKIDARVKKGRLNITRFLSDGRSGELEIKGHAILKSNLRYSYFDGEIRFRVSNSFKENLNTPALSLLKGLINSLGPGKSGFHLYKGRIPFRGRPRLRRVY